MAIDEKTGENDDEADGKIVESVLVQQANVRAKDRSRCKLGGSESIASRAYTAQAVRES